MPPEVIFQVDDQRFWILGADRQVALTIDFVFDEPFTRATSIVAAPAIAVCLEHLEDPIRIVVSKKGGLSLGGRIKEFRLGIGDERKECEANEDADSSRPYCAPDQAKAPNGL